MRLRRPQRLLVGERTMTTKHKSETQVKLNSKNKFNMVEFPIWNENLQSAKTNTII